MSGWLVHKSDPYVGVERQSAKADLGRLGLEKDPRRVLFLQICEVLRPSRVLEIGTWLGGSAILMANALKSLGLVDSRILCVDTWLGSSEHWLDMPGLPESFRLTFDGGHPDLFDRFVANVAASGHTDLIEPFPIDSHNAFIVLETKGLTFDVIYIDASHDYDSVKAEICKAWSLLRPNGMLLGDDYWPFQPGLVRAVKEFSAEVGVAFRDLGGGQWIMQKAAH